MRKHAPARADRRDHQDRREACARSGPWRWRTSRSTTRSWRRACAIIADGYDRDFIQDTLERDRDNFLQRLDEGQKIYRSIGDAAPAWGMIGTLLGMVQMFANMSDPSKLGPVHGGVVAGDALWRARRKPDLPAHRGQTAPEARGGGHLAMPHHRRHPADPRRQEPCDRARDAAWPTCPTTTATKWPKRPDRERGAWRARRAADTADTAGS